MSTDNDDKSTHFYLRCDDDERLVLVERSLFTMEGNVASGSWFGRTFGAGMRAPPMIGRDTAVGLPIYHAPMMRCVLCALLMYLRLPEGARSDMRRHLPPLLKSTMTLATWRHAIEWFAFMPEDEAPSRVSKQARMDGNEAALVQLAKCEQQPMVVFVARVADALAAKIAMSHPKLADMRTGARDHVKCTFVNFMRRDSSELSCKLDVPGEPPIEPIRIAHFLYFRLSVPAGEYGCYNLTSNTSMRGHQTSEELVTVTYLFYRMQRYFRDEQQLNVHFELSRIGRRESKAKRPVVVKHWPAVADGVTSYEVTHHNHDVVELTIRITPLNHMFSYDYHKQLLIAVDPSKYNSDESESQ